MQTNKDKDLRSAPLPVRSAPCLPLVSADKGKGRPPVRSMLNHSWNHLPAILLCSLFVRWPLDSAGKDKDLPAAVIFFLMVRSGRRQARPDPPLFNSFIIGSENRNFPRVYAGSRHFGYHAKPTFHHAKPTNHHAKPNPFHALK